MRLRLRVMPSAKRKTWNFNITGVTPALERKIRNFNITSIAWLVICLDREVEIRQWCVSTPDSSCGGTPILGWPSSNVARSSFHSLQPHCGVRRLFGPSKDWGKGQTCLADNQVYPGGLEASYYCSSAYGPRRAPSARPDGWCQPAPAPPAPP